MGSGPWVVTTTCESVLTWNYDVSHQGLRDLYEKAKQEQWNVSVDVDWSPAVDPEAELLLDQENPQVALIQDSAIWRKMNRGILPLATCHCGGSTMICPSPSAVSARRLISHPPHCPCMFILPRVRLAPAKGLGGGDR